MIINIIVAAIAALAGAAVVYVYYTKIMMRVKSDLATARAHEQSLEREIRSAEQFADQMGVQFKALASDALNAASDRLAQMSMEKMDASGSLISQDLKNTKANVQEAVAKVAETLEGLTKQSTTIEEGLRHTYAETKRLSEVTGTLNEMLSSSQARGAWGERMVEDILTKLGMVEGINYIKQTTIGTGERPDFTFLLPLKKKVNMDVKFPLAKYKQYIESTSDAEGAMAIKGFMTDVKGHITTLAKRGYINVAEGTIDLQIMFIPNEAIYSCIHQNDPGIADYAMDNKIVMCSPITFYGILSMINQATESFAMSENISKVMGAIANFQKEYDKFGAEMDKIGSAIDKAKSAYDSVVTTRANKLERSLAKVNELTAGNPLMLEG